MNTQSKPQSPLAFLAKQSFIYTLGSVVQSSVAIFLVPLYTRTLSPALYGLYELTNTIFSVFLFFLSLGFASALLKLYTFDTHGSTDKDRQALVGTAFLFLLPFVALSELIVVLFARPFAAVFFGDANLVHLVYLVLGGVFFAIVLNMGFALLRSQERSRAYTVLFLTRFFLLLSCNVLALVVFKVGVFGLLLGNLISYAATSLLLLPLIWKSFSWKFSWKHTRALLAFGIPLIPASLGQWLIDLSDRYFLRVYRSLDEVGIYSLAYKIGFVVMILLVAPFQLAWPSISFRIARDEHRSQADIHAFFQQTLHLFFVIGFTSSLALGTLAPWIIHVFATDRFLSGASIVWLVALSYVLYGGHFILASGIHIARKTSRYPWLVLGPAVLNVILNFFLVETYGMFAAAWTTFAAFFVMFIVTAWQSMRAYPLNYQWGRLLLLAIVYALFIILEYVLRVSFSLPDLARGVIILGGWTAVLYGAQFFSISLVRKLIAAVRHG